MKLRVLSCGVWCGLALLSPLVSGTQSGAAQAVERKSVAVFERGKANLYLDAAPVENAILQASREDFARCFAAMTGQPLPQQPLPQQPLSQQPLPQQPLPQQPLPQQAGAGTIPLKMRIRPTATANVSAAEAMVWNDYRIDVKPTEILIESYSAQGLSNGLYDLLDRWGCHWVMPGTIGEILPPSKSLSLPVGVIEGKISSDFRVKTYTGTPESRDWMRRNRNGTERWSPAYHNWANIVPVAIYNDPKKPETYHPEYYALVGGKRTPTQLCTSNPAVVALAIESAKEFFRTRVGADSFPMDCNDNIDFCQCENCRALDPPGVGPDGLPLMTDRVVTFANAVARGIRDEFPGKYVSFYSYNNHTETPVRVKPEPEISIGITRSNYDLLRLVPREKGDSASRFYKLITDWKKLVPRVFTYEYNPIYWNGNLICPNYLDWGQTLKDTLKLGSSGAYSDGMISIDNTTNFLNYYVLFRISADATRDPKQEIREMCRVFYGPAANKMFDYYMTMAHVTDHETPPGTHMGGGLRYYADMFTPAMIRIARQQLDAALSQAPAGSLFRQRVDLADLNQKYLEAFLAGVWKAKAHDYEGSVAAFDRMDAIIPELGKAGLIRSSVMSVEDTQRRMNGIRLISLSDNFPDKLGMVRRWMLLGPLDNSSRGAELSTDPFQPILSIEKPVQLADGTTLNWKQYESPTGFLDFRKAFGKTDPQWTALYAYVGTRVKSPDQRKVELRLDSFNSFRVFLNGREVYYRAGLDLDQPDKRRVPVTLEAGDNTIVVKCTHTADSYAFPWGLYFRITDAQGQPVKDLAFSP